MVQITAHFAGVALHSDDVEAFHEQVTREAGVAATVDWSRRFPDMYASFAEHLALHTALVSCAQAHALDLYATGFENVPDPLDDAQREVSIMHALGLVTDFELVWHHAKFDQDHTEVARERGLLRERLDTEMPQLGRCHRVWCTSHF